MALNFPDSPTLNQVYTDSTSGFSYQWNGTVWISYSASTTSNITELDNISASFNGSTTIFPLTVNGTAVSPASTNQLLISVGGVMQNPTNDFYISGSNIVFTDAPASGLTFFGYLLGTAVPIGVSTIGDVYNRQTYAVTGVQTNFTFTTGYTVGYLDVFRNGSRLISGDDFTATNGTTFSLSPAAQNGDDVEAIGYKVSTIAVTEGNLTNLLVSQNARVLGITTLGVNVAAGQTALTVQGNARVTGILTVGSSSITLNGSTDQINVGSAVTINSSGLNVVGIVTATSFMGDGSNLTGVISPISVSSFNPASGATGVGVTTPTITITYNTPVRTGVGTITLRTDSFTGTIVESYDVATSSNISINQAVVTITPTSDFLGLINYYLVVPPSAIVTTNNVGLAITTYNFTSQIITNRLYAWGNGTFGVLAQNNLTQYSSPVQIPGTTWSSIDGGSDYSIASKTDRTLWAWGRNLYGQLGQNSSISYALSPQQIPGTTWSSITAGGSHSLATKTDGTLWSWGYNTQGSLGQNNTTQYSSPVQVPGTTWSSVSGGAAFTVATKTDGTLWAWGNNGNGQLGQSNITLRSSPVQIPGTTWSSITAGSAFALATKTDGTLWGWGSNAIGNLGQSNTYMYSSPIQIPGTTWSSMALQNSSTLATKTDGTLWSWGSNSYGQLGQNNRTNRSSPVQIPGNTWSFIGTSSSSYHALASKTDGTLWVWGRNLYGQLGQSNLTYYSSPVQIPGTTWSKVSTGGQHSLAIG